MGTPPKLKYIEIVHKAAVISINLAVFLVLYDMNKNAGIQHSKNTTPRTTTNSVP